MPHIVVSGPIGAGKTTASTLIGRSLDLPTFLEDYVNNPFLEHFYADTERWALPSQLFYLAQTVEHQRAIRLGSGGVQDHSAQEVHLGFDVLLHERGVLDDHAFDLLDRLYNLLMTGSSLPDLVVLLEAKTSTLLKRIARRGRTFERGLDAEFLAELTHRKRAVWEDVESVRLLCFDTDRHDLATAKGAAELIAAVRASIVER